MKEFNKRKAKIQNTSRKPICCFKEMLLNKKFNDISRESSTEAERNSEINLEEILKEENNLFKNNSKLKYFLKFAPISRKIIYSPLKMTQNK